MAIGRDGESTPSPAPPEEKKFVPKVLATPTTDSKPVARPETLAVVREQVHQKAQVANLKKSQG